MTLGEKILRARQAAGLSQRQLCGEVLTRSMLSQIEHDRAEPSIRTLQYLASRLGKPMGYFLDQEAVTSPNRQVMDRARDCFDRGDHAAALGALKDYRPPDPVYDRERGLLEKLCRLALAKRALEEGRIPYAKTLLDQAEEGACPYCQEELERRRLLLLGRAGEPVGDALPSLDGELLLRAREALEAGRPARAAALLEAAQDHTAPDWALLRGRAALKLGAFSQAAQYLHAAEGTFPKQTAPLLEECYRELGDFRRAYEYACKQK